MKTEVKAEVLASLPFFFSLCVRVCVCERARARVCLFVPVSRFLSHPLTLNIYFSLNLNLSAFTHICTLIACVFLLSFSLFSWGSQQKKSSVNPLIVYREGCEIQFRL